jgi:hypothetical protein
MVSLPLILLQINTDKISRFWFCGAVLPVVLYVLAKKFPRSPTRYLHAPIIFGGVQQIPP